MTEAHKRHLRILSALSGKKFDSLVIRKLGDVHFLVVTIDGEAMAFADLRGKHKTYRHTWQIRSWLRDKYAITEDLIPVVAMQG